MKIFSLLDPVCSNKTGWTMSRMYNSTEVVSLWIKWAECSMLAFVCFYHIYLHFQISPQSYLLSSFFLIFSILLMVLAMSWLRFRWTKYQVSLVSNLTTWNEWVVNSWNKYAIKWSFLWKNVVMKLDSYWSVVAKY